MRKNKGNFIIGVPCSLLWSNNISFDDWILENIHKRNNDNPFRVVVLGQSGVGKSTTVNAVFGLKNYVYDVVEGTTEIVEKCFTMHDGFKLSIYDMPGLNNDIDKEQKYEEMCKKKLPGCDVIIYVINAHSRDFGEDCRILKEVVLPICNTNSLRDNLILAFNKIDTIGETENPNDSELRWDIIKNLPTERLKKAIRIKIGYFVDKLIDENILGCVDSIKAEQIAFYSAVYNYNIVDLLRAITKNKTVGNPSLEMIGKWRGKCLEK